MYGLKPKRNSTGRALLHQMGRLLDSFCSSTSAAKWPTVSGITLVVAYSVEGPAIQIMPDKITCTVQNLRLFRPPPVGSPITPLSAFCLNTVETFEGQVGGLTPPN